ncbi:HlyD family efflux transporter periplasmic adaptor subunit [Croceitalea marina]|uniref:HlyD family efflux transporter periplasmic adaptor subunit n=1 Tax=Croceitalea marina TaxID=1775166 RepID=A0ABW5MVT6_9FLAO
MDKREIRLRSEAIQELMGRVPHWMVRWGNSLILILIVGVLVISYVIKYPNSITAKVLVTTTNPTQNMYAPITGNLAEVNVKDGQMVEENALLTTFSNNETDKSIRASNTGQVHFVDFWKTGMPVKKGELLFRIVPTDYGAYIGRLELPHHLKMKIDEGDQVRIRIAKDQLMEFEMLEGVVQNITAIANEKGAFQVEIAIGDALVSESGKKIDYQLGMSGTADIITEDLRLIERFFYRLKDIFND